ncbi:transcriptional regulator with XRE-family HTH domain [Microbacterium proteolyticum]|uniref:Transcriptional regulator with XRE-family HTH domain n=1 Tax=Microbacterium proteolyticum TaxID=1572644 RepID=A0A7W5GF55_9MICO|nr:helix-turn-helix transcriptional regulator [Microbacterium proteolyticum]MBB3158244.1 transcriptional regulator with XRE-family HTH domain [Microbacterium proteolyticum]
METIQNNGYGAVLRALREELGWGRRELARRALIGYRYLRRVECGRTAASRQWVTHVMSVMAAELRARSLAVAP